MSEEVWLQERAQQSIKDKFNVVSQPDGSLCATYKDPSTAPNWFHTVLCDLVSLSEEFDGKTVAHSAGNGINVRVTSKTDVVALIDRAKELYGRDPLMPGAVRYS